MNDQTNPFVQHSFTQNTPPPAANSWASPSATTTPLPNAFPFGSMRMPEPQIPGRNAPALYNSQTFPGGRINSPAPQNAWDNTPSAIPPTTTPYSPTIPVETRNAWDAGGNASAPSPQPGGNAYQFAGTRYANEPQSPEPAHTAPASAVNTPALAAASVQRQPSREDIEAALPPVWRPRARDRPSKTRLYLRIAQALASAGSFAFQFAASPASGRSIPFSNTADFYFLGVVAWLSLIADAYFIAIFSGRSFGYFDKPRRWLLILIDFLLTAFWGIAVVLSVVQFQCPVGGYRHWCDFANVGLFFGYVAFVEYFIALMWDLWGSCNGRTQRKKEGIV